MKCYFALLLSSSHTKLLLTPVPFKKRTTSYLVDGEEFWISVILIARGKLKRTYKSRHTCCLGCFTEGLPQCAVPPVSAQISRVPSRWRRHSVSLWERTCQNKFDRKKMTLSHCSSDRYHVQFSVLIPQKHQTTMITAATLSFQQKHCREAWFCIMQTLNRIYSYSYSPWSHQKIDLRM